MDAGCRRQQSRLIRPYSGDLRAALAAQPFSTISPGSEFRPAHILAPLLSRHPLWSAFSERITDGAEFPLRDIEWVRRHARGCNGAAQRCFFRQGVAEHGGWLLWVDTPPHIKAIREMAANFKPRSKLPDVGRPKMWLSGLEDHVVEDVHSQHGRPFLNVGERCSLRGSIKFKKVMMAGDFGAAMDIAKKQVEDGAHVIDIKNVDDCMLDGLAATQTFVKIAVTAEPEIAKVMFMLDALKFDIVLAGLKWCQGKRIINSISLKVGEE